MKTTIIILYCFLSIGIIYSQDTKTIAQNVLKSTVLIIAKDANSQTLGLGSGFIIESGFVVTNVHVIEGAKSIFVKQKNSTTEIRSTGYVAIDMLNDLVILKVPSLIGQSLSLATKEQEIGEVIYVVGNPSGLMGTFSDGLISGIRNFEGRKLIQISAPISPGSSGGPVVNKNSELIGISVGGMKDGQNLNFCIPAEYLITLMQNIGVLRSFNIPKIIEEKEERAYKGIKEGVIIRDLQICKECRPIIIESFSIFNNLSQGIKDVKLLFIVYDSYGIPINSYEETFIRANRILYSNGYGKYTATNSYRRNDVILPKLAKQIKLGWNWGFIQMNPKNKLEIRILDYDIVENIQ